MTLAVFIALSLLIVTEASFNWGVAFIITVFLWITVGWIYFWRNDEDESGKRRP